MKFPGSHKIVGTVYSDDTCRKAAYSASAGRLFRSSGIRRKAEELEKEEMEKE